MANHTSIPSVFSFNDLPVRSLMIQDQPWFVASDVCDALGYADVSMTVRKLDDDEKGTRLICTPSGEQGMLVINESGLYSLILRSRKAEAKRFKKWVTAEVLPAIRKTGAYQSKLKPTTKALPGCLTTDQQDAIKEMVRARVETLPHEKQKGAAIRCWSSLKSKFGVTYKEIPSEHYPEAVSLLARLPLDGEVIEKQPDQDIIQQAFGFGATVAGEVVKSMVSAMIEGSTDLSLDRWLVSLDSDGKPYARPIDRQAIVCSIPKLAKEIGAPCGIMATDKELLELAMACNHALSIRLRGRGAQAQ